MHSGNCKNVLHLPSVLVTVVKKKKNYKGGVKTNHFQLLSHDNDLQFSLRAIEKLPVKSTGTPSVAKNYKK